MTWWSVAAWIPAGAWLYLLLFRDRFWLPEPRLEGESGHSTGGPGPDRWPPVAIVIPARNEAEMITASLPTVLGSDYPGPLTVTLVDDCSDDGTGQAARAAGAPAGAHRVVRVVSGDERPTGWVGKTWALAQGVEAACGESGGSPRYVLFTDADIAHPAGLVTALVAHAEEGEWDLVSLMARLRVASRWEKLIVPAFVYFFSQLYPFRSVARSRSRTAAAAGGCVMVRTTALERAGGVAAISGAVIDDVALGKAVKRSGGRTWLGYADEVRSLRPYPTLGDLWNMVARSAYTQLRHSPVALAGTVIGLAVLYLAPAALVVAGAAAGLTPLWTAGAAASLILVGSYLPMVSYYRLNPAWALALPAAAALYGAMTVDSARRHRRGRGAEWKGRVYGSDAPWPGPSSPGPPGTRSS